jgi:hypothetical protein
MTTRSRTTGAARGWTRRIVPVAHAAIVLGAVWVHPAVGLTGYTCGGDCDRDRTVTVDELVKGVSIAIGATPLDQCAAFDCDGNGQVTVDCLIKGVKDALQGCPSKVADSTLSGPVSGGAGKPFILSTSFDLSQVGYSQVEYLFAGTASAYANVGPLGPDGQWTVTPAATAAYKTRLLIYRPTDPTRFNGTVIVEWINVSAGADTAPDWVQGHTELIRDGFVWVGVSAQIVGVEGGPALVGVISSPLVKADPARYGSLVHPGDSFSYDIFSQAGQAIRHPVGVDNPLGDLHIARVVAAGESQSAFRMVTYINAVHPLAEIYDGFFVHSRGALGAALSEAPQPAIPVDGTAVIRTDIDVPVLIFETETDLTFLGYFPIQQADSEHVHLWEVAGTSHADAYQFGIGASDLGNSPDSAKLVLTLGFGCGTPINDGPQHFVVNAALAALDRWVRDGTPPPAASHLEANAGPPVTITRDANGNALGGVRTPQLDVPIAAFTGDGPTTSILCRLFGTTTPFDDAMLAELYPTHDAYVSAFDAATDRAVQGGFVLAPDGDLMKEAAADSNIGQ